jgi:hypothetical protein
MFPANYFTKTVDNLESAFYDRVGYTRYEVAGYPSVGVAGVAGVTVCSTYVVHHNGDERGDHATCTRIEQLLDINSTVTENLAGKFLATDIVFDTCLGPLAEVSLTESGRVRIKTAYACSRGVTLRSAFYEARVDLNKAVLMHVKDRSFAYDSELDVLWRHFMSPETEKKLEEAVKLDA